MSQRAGIESISSHHKSDQAGLEMRVLLQGMSTGILPRAAFTTIRMLWKSFTETTRLSESEKMQVITVFRQGHVHRWIVQTAVNVPLALEG